MSLVLVAHAVAHSGLSHLVADRPYRLKLSRCTLQRSWAFGAPLLVNAGLLFLTFYADRLIVAQTFGWSELALYGVALQLALLPSQIVGRAAASLVLPQMRAAHLNADFDTVWSRCLKAHLVMACTLALGFAALAPGAIALVYGNALRPDTALAAGLALAAGFRVLRTPFSQLAVATGRTGDPARANVIRAVALFPAVAFGVAGLPLAAIAVAAALGEAGATYRAFQLSRTARHQFTQQEAFA
jgi:O-antigen/teichoic acid export membrane protein